jgi:hypothetical protein
METGRGSTRSYTVENLLWKRLWTCLKPDNTLMMMMMMMMMLGSLQGVKESNI